MGESTEFTIVYAGDQQTFDAADFDAACEEAESLILAAADVDRSSPQRATECHLAHLFGPGCDDDGSRLLFAADPDDPACLDDDGHDLAEDGGPWSHGAEVSHRETCRRCGATRRTVGGWRDEDTGWRGVRVEWILPGEDRYLSDRPAQLERLCEAAKREGRGCADNLDGDYTLDGTDPREWADEHRVVAEYAQDHGYWLGQYAATYPLCDVFGAEVIAAFYVGLHERACEIAEEREAHGAA